MHGDDQHSHDGGFTPGAGAKDFGFAFALGTALNVGFVVVEAIWGVLANSTALLADAGHNLSDVLGLLIAWGASTLSRRPPSGRYTYGLRGTSILAALANAIFLLIAVGAIAWEALLRFATPPPVAGVTVMVVAGIGVLINAATAALFMAGRKHDLNIRGAFLHMAADAAVSFGVVAAGGLILLTGRQWIDPLTSLLIAAIVVWSTWGLLTEAVKMSLAAVPKGIAPETVRAYLRQCPGVAGVHDLHIWSMSTTEIALTAHLVMPGGHPGDGFLAKVRHDLRERFDIAHPTLQIETDENAQCPFAPDHSL